MNKSKLPAVDHLLDLLATCGVDITDPDIQQETLNCAVCIDNAYNPNLQA